MTVHNSRRVRELGFSPLFKGTKVHCNVSQETLLILLNVTLKYSTKFAYPA